MPRDTNQIDVVLNDNVGTDVAGNVIVPTRPNPQPANTQSTNLETTNPNPQGQGGNDVPLLITPVIDAPYVPKGSGSSIVVEPDVIEPIVRDVVTDNKNPQSSNTTTTSTTTNNPTKSQIVLPEILGGGILGGGGGSDTTQPSSDKPIVKKPKYILYIGILLALVITYKVLTKKEK
jgi:hypothetical protein